MNLYIRLFFVLLLSRFKSAVSVFEEFSTEHRVWPNDLDVLGHMNNGRYFTITDLARIEMLIRAGVWREMRKHGIYPVMAGETIQFRRSLMPFQKYSIITHTLGWDDKFIYVEHRFVSRGETYALAIVRTRMLSSRPTRNSPGTGKAGRVSPQELMQLVDENAVSETRMNEVLEKWNSSTALHWNDNGNDEA